MNLGNKLSHSEKKMLFETIWSSPSRLEISAVLLNGNIKNVGQVVILLEGDASPNFYTLHFSQGAYFWFLRERDALDVNFTLKYSNDDYPDYLATHLIKIKELTWEMVSDERIKDISGVEIDHEHWMKTFLLDKSKHVYFSDIKLTPINE